MFCRALVSAAATLGLASPASPSPRFRAGPLCQAQGVDLMNLSILSKKSFFGKFLFVKTEQILISELQRKITRQLQTQCLDLM
jgi:hypothetical protein